MSVHCHSKLGCRMPGQDNNDQLGCVKYGRKSQATCNYPLVANRLECYICTSDYPSVLAFQQEAFRVLTLRGLECHYSMRRWVVILTGVLIVNTRDGFCTHRKRYPFTLFYVNTVTTIPLRCCATTNLERIGLLYHEHEPDSGVLAILCICGKHA